MKNLGLEISFLIIQLNKHVGLCKNIVKNHVTQYSKHLPHSSEVFHSHTSHLAEDIYATCNTFYGKVFILTL